MSEEKKEKFTFSDKIKNSKSAASKSDAKPAVKPFAKSSSKIGKDGKPRQTIFERTRRDAPFFIAALVALLLLPFLYKYSGQSGEEELTIPVNEENIFNPDDVGYNRPFTEDPDGQIAQLSGRDSLSLIRGFGSDEQDYKRDDMDFDTSAATASDYDYSAGSEAEGKYAAARRETSDMDIENNTTNIYKRRAKKATRAAFRRPPTKIGALGPAAIRRSGGSGLNVRNWGGSIKDAAQKVKPTAPVEAPKPVSLQPLRAKSGRASFGGTAKAGRASRDALGKADAREALRDANVKPVDPTRVGGLNLFSMGPGGGGGKLERNINIGKGQEPWWWDMMKTRMQKEWEKRFERKWKWIDWADQIAMNILKGLINCILTGDDGGDVDAFLGSGGGAGGKAPTCCGQEEKNIGAEVKSRSSKGEFDKEGCDQLKGFLKTQGHDCPGGWDPGRPGSGVRLNALEQRWKCLGGAAGIYGSGDLGLKGAGGMDCAKMPDYTVNPSGEARKWNIYTYVVVRNYFPEALKDKFPALPKGHNLLCAQADRDHGGDSLNMSKGTTAVGHVESVDEDSGELETTDPKKEQESALNNVIKQTHATQNVPQEQVAISTRILEDKIAQEELRHACVIAVKHGNMIDDVTMEQEIVNAFEELAKNAISDANQRKEAAYQAAKQLDRLFIASFAAKDKLAFQSHTLKPGMLPMLYSHFDNAYIIHKGTTPKRRGSRDNVYKRKLRVEYQDMIRGPICFYDTSLTVDCKDDNEPPQATVTFKPSYKGGQAINLQDEINHLVVTAQYKPLNGAAGAELNMHDGKAITVEKVGDHALLYSLKVDLIKDAAGKLVKEKPDGYNIVWKVDRNASTQDEAHSARANGLPPLTATCTYNLYGDVPTPPVQEKQCKSAQESEECCLKINGTDYEWDASKTKGSQCVEKKKDECPQKENTNAKCCKDLKGANYQYDENHSPKCYLPSDKPLTRLAPVISWVPSTGTTACREDAGNDTNPTESTFAKCTAKIPGVVKNESQKCGSQQPMVMDSNAAAEFVKNVVAAYNKNLPAGEKQLSDKFANGKFPTDGEFIDALYLAKGLNIKTVPASAVCELGRDMVRMSRDKHTKEKKVAKPLSTPYGAEQWKENNTVFHNELGALLAYIHVESLFYPQKYYGSAEQCDYRFQVLGEGCPNMVNWASESCIYSGNAKCKEYHHNNYNNIPSAGAQAVTRYPQSLAPIQRKGAYLLKGLASGSYPSVGNSDGSKKGREYINRISPLLRESSGFTAWEGNACVVGTSGTADLKVEDVLKYVETACSVGLDFKPYGTPGSRNGSKPAPGQSGSDTGTQGN